MDGIQCKEKNVAGAEGTVKRKRGRRVGTLSDISKDLCTFNLLRRMTEVQRVREGKARSIFEDQVADRKLTNNNGFWSEKGKGILRGKIDYTTTRQWLAIPVKHSATTRKYKQERSIGHEGMESK